MLGRDTVPADTARGGHYAVSEDERRSGRGAPISAAVASSAGRKASIASSSTVTSPGVPNSVVVDRRWELVDANDAVALLTAGCAPDLLEPPCNVLRLCLHPDGLAPRIRTLGSWRAHLLTRLRHQIAATGDAHLRALLAELRTYPAPPADPVAAPAPVVPIRLRGPNGAELAFLSTTTLFGTPGDVTVDELAIEAFLPADDATAALLGAPRPGLRSSSLTA